MKKKRKRKKMIRQGLPPELKEHFEKTQQILAERIAYHEAKIEEERAQREREAS